MSRPCQLALLLLLLLSSPGRAQDVPERPLPAGAQVYFRWDGTAAHQAAYAKTALSKILQGETGQFAAGQLKQHRDQPLVRFLDGICRDGLILAADVRDVQPFQGNLILVLPNAKTQGDALLGTLRWAAGLSRTELQERKVMGRSVLCDDDSPPYLAAWVEGGAAVLVTGTDRPEEAVKRLLADQPRLP